MRPRYTAVTCLALLLHSESALAQLRKSIYVSGLTQPVAFVQDPGDPTCHYVAQQAGLSGAVRSGVLQPTPFLARDPPSPAAASAACWEWPSRRTPRSPDASSCTSPTRPATSSWRVSGDRPPT